MHYKNRNNVALELVLDARGYKRHMYLLVYPLTQSTYFLYKLYRP